MANKKEKKSRSESKKGIAIKADMTIAEIISKSPETVDVFLKYGFHCFGCMGASFENLRAAAKVHGIKLAGLLKDLNRAAQNRKQKK